VRSRVLGATVGLAVLLVIIAACENENPDIANQTLPAIQTTSTVPTTLLTTTTQPRFYEVQAGDTLFDIARTHGIPVEAIMQANGMTDANVLLAGQIIQLPLASEITTTTLPRPTTIPPSTALPLVPTLAP
jgi:LysM repeat protein